MDWTNIVCVPQPSRLFGMAMLFLTILFVLLSRVVFLEWKCCCLPYCLCCSAESSFWNGNVVLDHIVCVAQPSRLFGMAMLFLTILFVFLSRVVFLEWKCCS